MFEIAGVPEETAREAMRLAMHKLPIKCKFVAKEEQGGGAVMKASEIRDMSVEEMNEKLAGLKEELFCAPLSACCKPA